jgi:CRISPR-associated endonuclease/helicase Cas3
MHLTDTAAIAQKLWNHWLPDGIKKVIAAESTEEECIHLFVFLAAAHDLGKATPVFQSKQARPPCRELDERIEEKLIIAGLPMKPHCEFFSAGKTPHALASQILLKHAGCGRNAAVIPGAHHGKPPDIQVLSSSDIDVYGFNYHLEKAGKKEWSAVQQELIDFALTLAKFTSINDIPMPGMAAQILLSGLLIMADWIASNEDYFPYIRPEDKPNYSQADDRAQSAWKQLDLPRPWNAGKKWKSADLYRKRFNFTPHLLQSAAVQTASGIDAPGILVLEAPMGSGKTEAALACAEIFADKTKRSGVFFALPTQATSDGIFPRVEEWIEKLDDDFRHSIKLAHGKAQFNNDYQKLFAGSTNIGEDEDSGVFVHDWFEGQKRSLLADFVVGTIDQLLLAALKQKHVMLRHLGLAGKVVIIDECHAYDAYMGQYLNRALNYLGAYHVPVIVLSATLPAAKRKAVIDAYLNKHSTLLTSASQSDPLGRGACKPVQTQPEWVQSRAYPLLTYTDGDSVKQQAVSTESDSREVRLEFQTEEGLTDKLDELLKGGGCAGVVVNTVKRAQDLAERLREHFGEETVRLLHSRFLAPDRSAKEEMIRKELGKPGKSNRPQKRIVVGTQVLEQSLDIDFDILATDICPMDLLLQRIGRLHRHKRIRPEKLRSALCLILGLDGESFDSSTKIIYGEYLLMRTRALVPQKLILPQDIPQLVQDAYDEDKDPHPQPAGYLQAKETEEKKIADKEKRARDFRISPLWADPEQNLAGWLDTDVSEKHGEAAVRDTDESIEVLLVQEKNDSRICFLPWIDDGGEITIYQPPDDYCARMLACQRIRLPRLLCASWAIDKTIAELELLNSERLSAWQESKWLKGELFLILDEAYSANLGGYRLTYDRYYGLLYEKEDRADG